MMSQALLESLFRELYQTERSADVHCRRQAHQLGDVPPGRALLAVADHARRTRRVLDDLAIMHGIAPRPLSSFMGRAFSDLRRGVLDKVFGQERSYRVTLLGIQHGVDLVSFMVLLGQSYRLDRLVDFGTPWLVERQGLLALVRAEEMWFVRHPERALARLSA